MRSTHAAFIAASIGVTALIAGCSSSSSTASTASSPSATSSGTPASSPSAAAAKYTVAYVTGDEADPYFITERCGAEAEAKSMGATLDWFGSTSTSASVEYSTFGSAAVTKPDAVVLAPFSDTGFGASVNKLMSEGVPVSLTGGVLTPAAGYQTVESNYVAGGELLASTIGALTGGTGTVAIIAQSTGNPPDAQRYTGLLSILAQKYPKLKVLSPQYGEAESAKSAQIASALILANPDLKLIYATNGPQAIGAASAIRAANAGSRVKLVSFDSTPDQINLINSGELAATVGQSPYYTAALGVKAVVAYLDAHGTSGGAVTPAGTGIINTPLYLITKANVDTSAAKKYLYVTSCSALGA